MTRYARNLAILATFETTYGTDAAPTAAANAILCSNVSLEPLAGNDEERENIMPWMGHSGIILTGNHVKMSMEVEIAGAGTAGGWPGWSALHRACGLAATVTAGEKVEYTPVSSDFESATIYYIWDRVKYGLVGARGNLSLVLEAGKIPRWKYDFVGLEVPAAYLANPAAVYTGFQDPVPVSDANTIFSLHGQQLGTERLSLNLNNSVEPRLLINKESIEMTDRRVTGEVVLEAALIGEVNWLAIAKAHTTGMMFFEHGTVAGNIVRINCPKTQIGRPKIGQSQKILTDTLPLILQPGAAGNNELTIVCK